VREKALNELGLKVVRFVTRIRAMILSCLLVLYVRSRDAFFLIVTGIVSIGVLPAVIGHLMDKREISELHNNGLLFGKIDCQEI